MNYLFLIPISLGLGGVALVAFLWNLRTNQYEDLDGAAERVLLPNAAPDCPAEIPQSQSSPNAEKIQK